MGTQSLTTNQAQNMEKLFISLAFSCMLLSLVSSQFTLCSYANNTIGSCDCPGQVFVADDCHQGFYCIDFTDGDYPDDIVNANYDGCKKECAEDEVLIIDPIRADWTCVPIIAGTEILNSICPGKFNTECGCNDGPDACPLGECECQDQLRVSDDCHKARFCNGTDFTNPDHYVDIDCAAPNIVFVNMVDHTWECKEDDGRCPGAFHVGCQAEAPTMEPTMEPTEDPKPNQPITICSYAKNDLGTCECPGQVFISDECHKGFVCIDFTDGNYPDAVVNGDYDGCVRECREDEVLVVDPRLGDWNCVPLVVNATALNSACPGKFNTECACTGGEELCPIGECECDGQLRVAHDCHDARYCNGTELANPDDHVDINCPGEEIVYVNLATQDWYCGPDDGRCPGAFHVGCQDDSNNGSSSFGLSLMMAVTMPMVAAFVYSVLRI